MISIWLEITVFSNYKMIPPHQHNMIMAGLASTFFIIFSLPVVYSLTSKIAPAFMQGSSPSLVGITAHALVVFGAMYLTLMVIDARKESS